MDKALLDYFRCPADAVRVKASTELSADRGFFRFGGSMAYGRCAGAVPARQVDGNVPDVLRAVTSIGESVRLPFDLSEVVDNLRYERYCTGSNHSGNDLTSLSRRVYYFLRPILGVAVRKHLQRIRLAGWDRIPFPTWPLDLSVENLLQTALLVAMRSRGIDRVPFIWFWPGGAEGCAILTHDVEATAGRDFCSQVMDIDDSFGIKAAFQLVPEVRYDVSAAFRDEIRGRGFEVNVHDLNHDGRLFQNKNEFLQRAEHINRYVREFGSRGFRAGAMYRNQEWYDAFAFSYDMSVPNVAHLEPQRGGCCTVMPYFIGSILEVPLTTIQDYSLFHILGDYSITLWRDQIRRILDKNGLITLLVHPDYLMERRARDVYLELLAHVAQLRTERNLWTPLPRELDEWWRIRQQLRLSSDRGLWRVEGVGADRARVAYATIDGDQLVYTVQR